MMTTVLALAGLLATLAAFTFFVSRLRLLQTDVPAVLRTPVAHRYRPMLRLLSTSDLAFAPAGPQRRSLRAARVRLLRGYLRDLARDYGQLLSGIRLLMVHSEVDRPDLARALVKGQVYFALALCRIELRLVLHLSGVADLELGRLLEAAEALRAAHAGLLAGQASAASASA